MSLKYEIIETDVLVVGSEGAGSRAAIEVSRNGLRVLVATKGRFTHCGATLTADMTMDIPSRDAKNIFGLDGDPADTPESFAENMFEEGKYMNNEEVILAHCTHAGKYIRELADWGMRIDGLAHRPGHRYPRGLLSTGRSMMNALKKGTRECQIAWAEDTMVTDLLVKSGRAVGAVGINIRTGEFLVIKAKAIILATGGAMRLYPITTAPEELTGDGFYMAYQAGAEMVDMEFPLFLPACLYWPKSMQGVDFSYVYSVTVNGWWLNKFGVRFIEKWDSMRMEQGTTRDIASIAMAMEALEGRGSPHGGIYVSFKHLPEDLLEYNINQHEFWKNFIYGQFDLIKFNMDPRKVSYEAGPAAHYWNGGIKVNSRGETNVPGLYAAGEVQGGTMGANRLGGNAVTECLVFGALTGGSAAAYAQNAHFTEIDKSQVDMHYERIHAPLCRKDGMDVYDFRDRMQDTAFESIGVIRKESGMTAGLEKMGDMKKEIFSQSTKAKGKVYNREWIAALENEAMLLVMEIIARTSLMRKESRGALYRQDYPDTDNKDWLKNIIVKNKNNQVGLEARQVMATKMQLPKREKTPYMVPQWKFEKKSREKAG